MPEKYKNVAEAWPIYDTLVVCPEFFGTEDQNRGWFTSFPAFSAQDRHSFFNIRTEATAGLAYCNKQQTDSMDFAYEIYSIGCAFIAPGVRTLGPGPRGDNNVSVMNTMFAHWWETVLPRHCSVELKVQQDIIMEMPAMALPPGYGPTGSGAAFAHDDCVRGIPNGGGIDQEDYWPLMNFAVTQGTPTLKNRWPLVNKKDPGKPIGVPRTGQVEVVLRISEWGRWNLERMGLNPHYIFTGVGGESGPSRNQFPARFMIQVSLMGKRLVQQRANYFA